MSTPNLTFVFDRKGQTKKDKKKTGVVELRISYNNVRTYMSTGIWLKAKEWQNGKVVDREDWKVLNDQLGIIYKKCSEIVVSMMEEESLDIKAIPRLYEERIAQGQTFLEYAHECTERRKRYICESTQKRYKVILDFLEEWKGIVYFSDVTDINIQKMDEYLADRGLKVCSRYNYHKIVKHFVRQAFADGLITKNPYGKIRLNRGDENGIRRVLTPKEFRQLETCLIPNECYRRVRDLFVFQTYTMMGYADLKAFDYKKCRRVKGHMTYTAKRKKTGQEFTFMLLDPAMKILKKYKYELPIISDQKYNDYLKVVAGYAKIDKPLTSHYARHTGATLLLNDGKVPLHIIQHILGHATLRETERTYAKLMDETIVESMADYQRSKGFSVRVKGV